MHPWQIDIAAAIRDYAAHTSLSRLQGIDGSCGACIARCPAHAITLQGHDKDRCFEYVSVTLASWARRPGYMGEFGACGLCQTGVPCESRIPGPRHIAR